MSFWTDPVGSVVNETENIVSDSVGFVEDAFNSFMGVTTGSSSIPTVTYTPVSSENLENMLIKEGSFKKQEQAAQANSAIQQGVSTYQIVPDLGQNLSSIDTQTESSAYDLSEKNLLGNQEAQNKADIANTGADFAKSNLNRLFLGGALGGVSSLVGNAVLSPSSPETASVQAQEFLSQTAPKGLSL